MILATKPLLIAAVGVVSVVGVASAWRSYQLSQEHLTREAEQHLLDGTAPPPEAPGIRQQAPTIPPDIESQFVILNADEYKQEITEIDRLVFEEQPMTKIWHGELAMGLETLVHRMTMNNPDSRFIAIEAQELRQLSELASKDAPRTTIQNHWMRIRNNVFDDRSWFARSAADLEPLNNSASSQEAPQHRADPFVPVEHMSEETKQTLEGRWRVKALFADGKPTFDPELANSLWMFNRNHLYISGSKSSLSHYTFTDSYGALNLEPDPSNTGPTEQGWMNYEFDGADLKVAFYDGLGERPEGFTPPAGKHEKLFLVAILRREP